MVMYKGAYYGAIAGFIATWSISTTIAVSELEIGLPMTTCYSVIGIALGLNNFTLAAYAGFGLHILTGTLLRAIVGAFATRWKRVKIIIPQQGMFIGIVAGVLIWLALFLPITTLVIQPSIPHIVTLLVGVETNHMVLSDDIYQSTRGIAISAILFHIIWGAISGFAISSLLRIRAYRNKTWTSMLDEK